MSTYTAARPAASPFDRDWVDLRLAGYARRARGGADPERLRSDLLDEIWPWIVRTADRMAAGLPPGSDRDGLRSEVAWEVFKAVQLLDWNRYAVWPALVKAHLRGAYSTAARADDVLTRGQRRARRGYLAGVEDFTHRNGRLPSYAERLALARALAPYGEVRPVMMGRALLVNAQPADLGPIAAAGAPEAIVLRAWTQSCVRRWIAEDLPPALSREAETALGHECFSAGLCRRLSPFAAPLLARLGGWP
ncbi:hypothetical protein AB0M29_12825 [Streptomyces sp. NPDC051976]|uniref:hypothetical protein n=1 Tax=Streptomyces sp. NPDC051976 TaxID=3154947 RepID=UPI003433183B